MFSLWMAGPCQYLWGDPLFRKRASVTAEGTKRLGEKGFPGRPTAPFRDFVAWLAESSGQMNNPTFRNASPADLYSLAPLASITEEKLIEELSDFCGVPFVARIEEDDAEFKTLSRKYCEAKLVVPVKGTGNRQTVVISNPFDWELLEDLDRSIPRGKHLALLLAAPGTLRWVLHPESEEGADSGSGPGVPERSEDASGGGGWRGRAYDPDHDPGKKHPLAKLAIELLSKTVSEAASHLMVEPTKVGSVVRAEVAGRSFELKELSLETGRMLVGRFKALSGMDLARKRTPQSGGLEIVLDQRVFKLRLSTSPTSAFENLVIRVLDSTGEAGPLDGLGMTDEQAKALREMARKEKGLVLFVGPLGSGKTTTIYSLLSDVADRGRSLATVEDPIEHKIPFANQMEVGEGAGVRALLREAIHGKPDVLFLSEIRDLVSAQSCVEFTEGGHLVLSSMNSSNAATAVFRLERLGVNRAHVAECLTGVVAQRLLRRLCTDCREIRPTSQEEATTLRGFTDEVPESLAHPVGCSSCRGTGFQGREAVYEVIRVGPRMSQMVRDGRPISDLREFAKARGDLLVGDHALLKVRELVVTLDDAYRGVLLEEGGLAVEEGEELDERDPAIDEGGSSEASGEEDETLSLTPQSTVLVVEDEEGTRFLLDQILAQAGYRVFTAGDGGEALLKLGAEDVDLILSDIYMPNLDGLRLLEILNQNGVKTPVILLTGEPSPEVEARGREMGVAAYLRKPIQRNVLLESIERLLTGAQD